MVNQATPDIAALRTEIKQLQADLARIDGTMREIAGHEVTGEGQQAQASAEKIWTEVKRQAGNLSQEIEGNPIASALAAFGAGSLLGRLLHRRHG